MLTLQVLYYLKLTCIASRCNAFKSLWSIVQRTIDWMTAESQNEVIYHSKLHERRKNHWYHLFGLTVPPIAPLLLLFRLDASLMRKRERLHTTKLSTLRPTLHALFYYHSRFIIMLSSAFIIVNRGVIMNYAIFISSF